MDTKTNGTTKTCIYCNIPKPLAEMEKDRRSPDGHSSRCRQCKSERDKAARAKKRGEAFPDSVPGYVRTSVTQRSIELFAAAGYQQEEIAALCR